MKLEVITSALLGVCSIMNANTLNLDSVNSDKLNEKNKWGTELRESNFHLGLDLQTKYVWRGMEMIPEESSPVVFPGINYQWKGFYAYAMGGYAINGKYAEVDLGVSYTWKDLTVGLSDYYYPTVNGKDDEYIGGKHNGHWLEASITYAPEKVPLWITISNFFDGDDDVYSDAMWDTCKLPWHNVT